MNQIQTIPLLKDHHSHVSFYALLHDCLNLQNIESKTDALLKIQNLDCHDVSVVLGWKSGCYRFTEEDLKELPPVIIVNLSLHSFLMSPSAEAFLKNKFPEVVANYKNPAWYEKHMAGMLIFLTNLQVPSQQKIKTFFDSLYRQGVYYIEEMLLPNDSIFSIIESSPFAGRTAYWTNPDTFKSLNPETQQRIEGIKLFTDGALGAGTAALSQPFKNSVPGYLLFSDEALYSEMCRVCLLGKGVAVHAIGDLATEQVVRTLGKLKADGLRFPFVRLEHCQFVSEKTAHDAKELGVILSMQPNFSKDSVDYKDRLPVFFIESNNPFRMLIDRAGFVPGEDLILGSDGMPHGPGAALQESLFPPYPQQVLTLEEFVAAYCMPDKKHGHIEVVVKNKQVITKVCSNRC
ncbi:MAG: amidohydrolase family protein [bacterium]|nr:amidohydrolase family protein [bacterium]